MLDGIMVSKHVGYLRVSTPKQGENGLGVEAQREAVRRYLVGHCGEQIAEFVEVEIGKRSDRPQLAAAVALAKRRKATLAGREARSITQPSVGSRHDTPLRPL
jgi:DNA invertase Pin-like site-specific DNA recombinase